MHVKMLEPNGMCENKPDYASVRFMIQFVTYISSFLVNLLVRKVCWGSILHTKNLNHESINFI